MSNLAFLMFSYLIMTFSCRNFSRFNALEDRSHRPVMLSFSMDSERMLIFTSMLSVIYEF